MRAVKNECNHFLIPFDTEICCFTVNRILEVCNLEVTKKVYLEKRNEKSRTGKGKSTLLNFIYSMQ